MLPIFIGYPRRLRKEVQRPVALFVSATVFGLQLVFQLVVSLHNFVVLASGRRQQGLLGDIGLSLAQRVIGLFVAAIGMPSIVNGVVSVVAREIAPRLRP